MLTQANVPIPVSNADNSPSSLETIGFSDWREQLKRLGLSDSNLDKVEEIVAMARSGAELMAKQISAEAVTMFGRFAPRSNSK